LATYHVRLTMILYEYLNIGTGVVCLCVYQWRWLFKILESGLIPF